MSPAMLASKPPSDASFFGAFYERSEATPRKARDDIVRVLKDWGLDRVAGDLLLIVTELVTNSVRHTDSLEVRVNLIRLGPHSLILLVGDDSTVLPDPPPGMPTALADGGRGLPLIRILAHLAFVRCRSGKRAVVLFEVPPDA
ncbi:ATP-binding protein [Streptomyces sp. NPDC000594]|uniref:ATP-binding protein n=1 Tax=Streptomyces sp. NPDC000594 TaxID=3154261 RepID=UPI0033174B62